MRIGLGLDLGRCLHEEDGQVGHGHGCTDSFNPDAVLVKVIAAVGSGQLQCIAVPTRIYATVGIRNICKSASGIHLPVVVDVGARGQSC